MGTVSPLVTSDSIARTRGARGHAECHRARPRVYVSGPMSGLPDLNFPAFNAAAATLRARGYEVVNPAEINVDPKAEWSACMRADIAQLVTCDALALLYGWQHSRGANLERDIAAALGMRIGLVDEYQSLPMQTHFSDSEGGEL